MLKAISAKACSLGREFLQVFMFTKLGTQLLLKHWVLKMLKLIFLEREIVVFFCGEIKSKFPKPFTREQNQALYASGLIAQNIAAEMVIRNKVLGQNALGQSLAGTAIISNVMHVYGYYFKYIGRDGWKGNDIDGYYQNGGNPHIFSAALLAYTAYSLQRMRQKEIPLFGVSLKF